jgi:hypothetical protein
MGIIDDLADEDGLVLAEGAFPVGLPSLVGVLEGVAGRLDWVGHRCEFLR